MDRSQPNCEVLSPIREVLSPIGEVSLPIREARSSPWAVSTSRQGPCLTDSLTARSWQGHHLTARSFLTARSKICCELSASSLRGNIFSRVIIQKFLTTASFWHVILINFNIRGYSTWLLRVPIFLERFAPLLSNVMRYSYNFLMWSIMDYWCIHKDAEGP